jgi:predicted RNase H-like HicB family nuclease
MEERKLIVTIARDENGFGAWIENCPGVYGEGDTVQEAKENLLEGLRLFIKHNETLPEILQGTYQLGNVSGYRNPSKKTVEKIDGALHRISDELNQVRLAI